MNHPAWCTAKHTPGTWPVHQAQIGADLELSADLAYAVYLQQVEGSPAEVNLVRRDRQTTTLTRLTPLEAGIIRDLFSEGLDLLAVQVGRSAAQQPDLASEHMPSSTSCVVPGSGSAAASSPSSRPWSW